MTGLTENAGWENEVYQLERTDPVSGGVPDLAQKLGMSNVPHQQLANRTAWLKSRLEALQAAGFVTQAAIDASIAALLDGAPDALNTLRELSEKLSDSGDAIASLTAQIANKLDASAYTAADVEAKLRDRHVQAQYLTATRGSVTAQARDENSNTHFWLRDEAGTARGVLFWSRSNQLYLRLYEADGQTVAGELRLRDDGLKLNGHTVWNNGLTDVTPVLKKLGLEIGTDVQAHSNYLSGWADIDPAKFANDAWRKISANYPALTFEDLDATGDKMAAQIRLHDGAFSLTTRTPEGDYVSTDFQIDLGDAGARSFWFRVEGRRILEIHESGVFLREVSDSPNALLNRAASDTRYQAKTQIYKSAELSLPANSSVTWQHGAGRVPDPDHYGFYLVWRGGSQYGFSDGDILPIASRGDGGSAGVVLAVNASRLKLASIHSVHVTRGDGQGTITLSNSNAKLVFWVRR